MKKLLLLLVGALFFISCGKKEGEVEGSSSKEKILVVGTNAEYKPYEYLSSNGELVGFDIEFMEALAKKLGYSVEWKNMSFDGLIPALNTGQVDLVIAGMNASEERRKAVDFSVPYYKTPQAILVNKNNNSISKISDLTGKTIGVQLGTIQENVAGDLTDSVKLYSSFTGAILDLNTTKIDGVVVGSIVAGDYLKNNPKLEMIGTVDGYGEGASIAFPKGNDEMVEAFNNEIAAFKESGEYEKLSNKHFKSVEG